VHCPFGVGVFLGGVRMTPPQLIPLLTAVLCEECERISESPNETCVGCGSKAITNLSRLLAKESPMLTEIERVVDEVLKTQ
jgi:hypothetical protein